MRTVPAAGPKDGKGTQEDNGKPDHMIPKTRFDEAVGKEREVTEAERSRADTAEQANAELTRQLAELRSKSKAESKPNETDSKPFTIQEIEKGIADKRITVAQGLALIQEQTDERTETRTKELVDERIDAERERGTAMSNEDRYNAAIPALADSKSKESAAFARELKHLLEERKLADAPSTRDLAFRMAFGPIEELEKPGSRVLSRSEETPSSDGRATERSRNEGDDGEMPRRQREYYEQAISAGGYAGWDDPLLKKELENHNWRAPAAV